MTQKGTLYLVGTPIGNLGDITKRAVDTLAKVDRIACEDTRRTRKLLSHLEISSPLLAVPSHDEARRSSGIVKHLLDGQSIAFVSDAGMPAISDPGAILVAQALEEGIEVVPVPGPSAVVAALAVSGFISNRFSFLGFLPRKSTEKRKLLELFGSLPSSIVLYEAPHRLSSTLAELIGVFGRDRLAVVCRELTKMHEETVRGSLQELAEHFRDGARGEVTIVISPPIDMGSSAKKVSLEEAMADVGERVSKGERLKDACKAVSSFSGIDARSLYREALERR